MARPKLNIVCSIENCTNDQKRIVRGYCIAHYAQLRNKGELGKIVDGSARRSKFYSLWFERKQSGLLCKEWLDFRSFEKDVSPKPEGNYFLMRLRDEPFGPTNFKWQEHLRRQADESRKEWWARKWAHRQQQFPGNERARSLKRFYGISIEQYQEMLTTQDSKCAICKQKETAIDGKTGSVKRLAIDHCHNSNNVRGLLCGRCNTTLGKIEDNIEILQSMIDYLERHK